MFSSAFASVLVLVLGCGDEGGGGGTGGEQQMGGANEGGGATASELESTCTDGCNANIALAEELSCAPGELDECVSGCVAEGESESQSGADCEPEWLAAVACFAEEATSETCACDVGEDGGDEKYVNCGDLCAEQLDAYEACVD